MTPAEILAALEILAQTFPSLMQLYQTALGGGTVTRADFQAAMTQYGADRVLAINAAAASGT